MPILRFALLVLLAVLLHVLLGWEWTVLAGIVAGLAVPRRGWLTGLLVVGSDWLILILFNFVMDARATTAMTTAVGTILGNLPSAAVVALTLLIGCMLGLLGGGAGAQLRYLTGSVRRKPVG